MSKEKKYKLSQVFDASLIPDGYVRNTKNSERGYLFSNYVCNEVRAGRVLAILLGGNAETGSGHGGAFYVHPEHMLRLESEWDSRDQSKPCVSSDAGLENAPAISGSQLDAAVTALCEINNGITVLNATLRDVVAAVELLREPPAQEPAGSWRDMNGEVMN